MQRNYLSPLTVRESEHGCLGVNELLVRIVRWHLYIYVREKAIGEGTVCAGGIICMRLFLSW